MYSKVLVVAMLREAREDDVTVVVVQGGMSFILSVGAGRDGGCTRVSASRMPLFCHATVFEGFRWWSALLGRDCG